MWSGLLLLLLLLQVFCELIQPLHIISACTACAVQANAHSMDLKVLKSGTAKTRQTQSLPATPVISMNDSLVYPSHKFTCMCGRGDTYLVNNCASPWVKKFQLPLSKVVAVFMSNII